MLLDLRKKFAMERSFEGLKIGICLPGTWESFMFLSALEAGGASIRYYPMFCQPEVGLELLRKKVKLFGYNNSWKCAMESDFIYDSTAFFGENIVKKHIPVKGIIEQTASGINIYKDFDKRGLLRQPVLDLDSSMVKSVGENKQATGLGLVEALLKLHLFLPGKYMLILGYGNVGAGCASYLSKMGCEVGVYDTESNALKRAEESGHRVGSLMELLSRTDIVVNATGSANPVLRAKELEQLKSGAILANMGGCGWDRTYFRNKRIQPVGDWVSKVFVDDDSYLYELAQGLPVNFFFASGSDTETMDMVFSLSVHALQYLVENYESLPNCLLQIPDEIQKKHLKQVAKFSARKNFGFNLEVDQ